MSHSTPPDCEPNSTSTLPEQPGGLVLSQRAEQRYLLAETYDPKVSIDTIVQ
jgi:hypothetical protein